MKPVKQSLYGLSGDLERLSWMLEESGGEITEDIDRYLTDTEMAVADKVASYIALIKNFEGLAGLKKSEKQRLDASKSADENIAKKLRARLVWFFQRNEITSLRTRMGTITLANNPPSKKPVLSIPEDEIPMYYKKTHTVTEIDYDKIREALESGMELDWAKMPEPGAHITIR
jgi:hypothetical protein